MTLAMDNMRQTKNTMPENIRASRASMAMDKDYICLGAIAGAQGIKGEVRVKSFTANPVDVASYGEVLGDNGQTYRLKAKHETQGIVVVAIDGVTDRNAAEAMKGIKFYIKRDQLPELSQNDYYHADLLGLRLEDRAGNLIGHIISVEDFGAGDVVEVKDANGKTDLCLPFTASIFPEVDLQKGVAIVELPEFVEENNSQLMVSPSNHGTEMNARPILRQAQDELVSAEGEQASEVEETHE
jgi:16S rRNA processing protein RimM